jgi:hypothetical protein
MGGGSGKATFLASMEIWRETNGARSAPDEITNEAAYWYRI